MRVTLLLLSFVVLACSQTCQDGSVTNTADECLLFVDNKMQWSDAQQYCQQQGGNLASVHNQFDNGAMMSMSHGACKFFWTGGQCSGGVCSWTDGTPFNFQNWDGKDQPDPTQNCISGSFSTNGKWRTQTCDTQECFYCAIGASAGDKTDCMDWLASGATTDGYYDITTSKGVRNVYCDMTTYDGGWVVFQKRDDGSESFWDRSWQEYKDGFGVDANAFSTNFWLGNDVVSELTLKDDDVVLRVEMHDDGTPGSAHPTGYLWGHYFNFMVTPESDLYRLNLTLDWQNVVGNASDGWYDITYSVGAPFSTLDKINDPQQDCVTKYQMGGWWLRNCALATLNGAYIPKDWSQGYGIFWIKDGSETILHPRRTRMLLKRNS